MSILHVDSVTKSYGDKVILSDIFLSCEGNEIKGLVGRNGSGKSTLLKIIFGTEDAHSKYIRVGDKNMRRVSDRRRLINYLPQDHFLPNGIKVKNLINLFLPDNSRKELFENELIKSLLDRRNQELSSGEKRIVEILLIIHSNAKFILLDEPFNGVSPIMRDYIADYIKKMKLNKGFVITDHDFENVLGLADNIVYLDNGYLKEVKDKKELIELGYLTKTTYNNAYNPSPANSGE